MYAHRIIGSYCAIAAALSCLGVEAVGAQQRPPRPKQQTGDVTFKAVSDLAYPPGATVVIGARPAPPGEFKASFYSQSADGACTSTLVGPRVLLTAAHCVANGGRIGLERGARQWIGTCQHAPGYASDETADWALCAIDVDVPGVPYERLNTNQALPAVQARLLLTGFGCSQAGGFGGNDGIYRVGDAVVREVPTSSSNDIVTKAAGTASAALCFGDSGGPGFLYMDAQKRVRVQVGVNSQANLKDASFLSSISTPAAKTFLRDWSSRTGLKICGVHADVTGCRPDH